MINELAEKEPLTISHIEELSPHSSQYIVPYNQKRSKRYGLILYTTYNRPGAQDEADNMEQSLHTAGFCVEKIEWNDAWELHSKLDSTLRQIACDCSLLVLCLMSHGSRGVLHGGDNPDIIRIYDVLQHLSQLIAEFIPMVRKHTKSLEENGFQVFRKIQIDADTTTQLVKLAVCVCKVGQPSIIQQNAYLRHNFFESFVFRTAEIFRTSFHKVNFTKLPCFFRF